MKKYRKIITIIIIVAVSLLLIRFNPFAHEIYARCRILFTFYNRCDYSQYSRVQYEIYKLGDGETGYVMHFEGNDGNIDEHFYISFDSEDQIDENYTKAILQKDNMILRISEAFQNEISQDIQDLLGNDYDLIINRIADPTNVDYLKEHYDNGVTYSKELFSKLELRYTLIADHSCSYEEITEKLLEVENYLQENNLENMTIYGITMPEGSYTNLKSEDLTENLPQLLEESKAGNGSHIYYHEQGSGE